MRADLFPRPRLSGSQFNVAGYQFIASCNMQVNEKTISMDDSLALDGCQCSSSDERGGLLGSQNKSVFNLPTPLMVSRRHQSPTKAAAPTMQRSSASHSFLRAPGRTLSFSLINFFQSGMNDSVTKDEENSFLRSPIPSGPSTRLLLFLSLTSSCCF